MADEGRRAAWIGLGIMGSRMAANLRRGGWELAVFNRTRQTAERWAAEHGARVADTPADAARDASLVFSMVVDGPQVEAVLLGPDGAAHGAAPGTLFVDCSTIAPRESRAIAAALAERGMAFMDAPVSGSAPKAADGTLTIMAGGDAADVDSARPALEAMSALIVHCGGVGQGQAVKLINNALAAANAAAVAQALVVASALEVDLDALLQAVSASSGASVMLDLKAPPMREHDFAPLFKLAHMLKDVRLCLDEADAAGAPFPAAAMAHDLLVAGMARGLGDQDFAALLEAVEGLAGRRVEG